MSVSEEGLHRLLYDMRRRSTFSWLCELRLGEGFDYDTLPHWVVACYCAVLLQRGDAPEVPRDGEAQCWRGFIQYLCAADPTLRDALDSVARFSVTAAALEARTACEAWWAKASAAPLVAAVQRRQGLREARIARALPRPPDELYVQEGAPPRPYRRRRK